MNIETRRVHDVVIIDMSGKLDTLSARDAEARLLDIIEGETGRVLLNLEKLAYVSSAGLRVIIQAGKVLQGNGGEIGICNARGGVRDVLEVFDMHSLMKIYDTEKEAFASFLA
jgi:anti-anti-sigma factor